MKDEAKATQEKLKESMEMHLMEFGAAPLSTLLQDECSALRAAQTIDFTGCGLRAVSLDFIFFVAGWRGRLLLCGHAQSVVRGLRDRRRGL